ncbi:MAG: hypothetical protein WBF58_22030 [Xanthobacteraceae bacterium]
MLRVRYPHDHRSMEPGAMKAQEIWRVATEVRQQLLCGRAPCLDIERLLRAAKKMLVNGIEITAHFDLDRVVRDAEGREVLGVTETDPAVPGTLLISLNREFIAGRDYLLRSTIAHEIGHALFDGPAMLGRAGRPTFALVTPDEDPLGRPKGVRGRMDWPEFRANEFMGGFLTPRSSLQAELVRRAISLQLPLRDAGEDQPVLRADGDPVRVEQLLFDLGERFGVSASLIEYRLRRYQLVR